LNPGKILENPFYKQLPEVTNNAENDFSGFLFQGLASPEF